MKEFADSVFEHTSTRVRGVSARAVAWGLVVLAVVPLLLMLGLSWHLQQRNLLQRAANDLAALASLTAASQEQAVEGTRQMLAAVSSTPIVMNGDWVACNALLQRLSRQVPNYAVIGVIDLDGTLVCRSSGSGAAVHLGDRSYFRQIVAGAPFVVGEYVVGRITGSKTIPFAYPVRAADGLRAVAFVGMDLDVLQRRLRAVPLPPGVSAVVTDGGGAVLASAGEVRSGTGTRPEDPALARALASTLTGAMQTQDAEGRQYLHHVQVTTGAARLRVAVSASVDTLVRPAAQPLGALMAALLGLLLAYAALIWWLGRRWLLQPLENLVQAMRRIELGSYSGTQAPRSARRVREIRVLQRGLNAMWVGLARRARERDAALATAVATGAEMRAVLGQMSDGFLILDHDWCIKYCNPRAAELVLRDAQELGGQKFWALFPDDRSHRARDACQREVGHGRAFAFEEYHAHYSRWFEIRVFASEEGIGVFLRDSTPHWEMIEELRARERRYRELFEANPNVMWIFDTQTLEFLAVNAAAQRRYGYSEAEFLSMHATDVSPPDDREQFVQSLQQASPAHSLGDEPGIWRHVTRHGELMLVDVTHHEISFKGRPARLVMATDVTSRLAAESRLRVKLEKLAMRHAEATSTLKASRQVLGGYIRMITTDVLPTLRRVQAMDVRAVSELERLRRKGARVGQMLEESLRLTQIGRAPFALAMADLSAMAQAILEGLRLSHPQRKVHVEVAPGLACRCDPALAQLLLQALLDNAWKFTAREPNAWIRVGRATSEEGSPVPVFFVSDNGVGFDNTEEDRLYKPFARLHSGAEFPGFGVGLATARAVVARHGGRIWAQSTPGQGATFNFELEGRPQPAGIRVSEVVIESLPPWED